MSARTTGDRQGRPPLELWGGLECTVARIGDAFRDQCVETGHRDRPGDLDAIAAMGIRTLRYPVLWETIAPDRPGDTDWSWHDGRLTRLRELGIRPIAGLIHHGSGPRSTDLLDPDFPRLFARHAAAVARRYPWIEDFTPVNEPLTTARFSGLYGHWYPHRADAGSFLRALVHQCHATVLAMRAIRRVTPNARLVQTEDLGKTFSTPPLAYQAGYENERRWLSFDLLCGRIDRSHPWWRIFRDHGIAERRLVSFLDREGTPDIIGINHYLTSERFLDGRLDLYPTASQGGNGRDVYADIEAVRVDLPGCDLGPTARLREVWERYRLPVAVTEVHHGCTRDEQLRWLAEVWDSAQSLRTEGADIRAVTLWSLFGTVDWNTLLTRRQGIYEPGAFDIRGPSPRPTALAQAGADLCRTGAFAHPVLDRPGWWHRDTRFYGFDASEPEASRPARRAGATRALVLTDVETPLGAAFARLCTMRGLDYRVPAAGGNPLAAIEDALRSRRSWAVIDTGGETDFTPRNASLPNENAIGLARLCASEKLPLAVFAREDDVDAPAFERAIVAAHHRVLILRSGLLFGPWDRDNAVWRLLDRLSRNEPVEIPSGMVRPTYLPDLVHVALDLLIDRETGIWPLADANAVPWRDFAHDLAHRAGFDPRGALPIATSAPAGPSSGDGAGLLPPLASALDRFFGEAIAADWSAAGAAMRVAAE